MEPAARSVTPAVSRQNPWLMLFTVLVRPRATLAQLRGRAATLQPMLALWLVNLAVAYLRLSGGAGAAPTPALPDTAPAIVLATRSLASVTSPLFGTLLNVWGASLFAGLVLAAAGALLRGESRIREAWSLALYASVPAQLIAPLVTAVATQLAPALRLKAGNSLIATALLAPGLQLGRTTYLMYLLDPLHLWGLGLLAVGLVAIMRLSWPRAAAIAGGGYLLMQGVAFINVVMLGAF